VFCSGLASFFVQNTQAISPFGCCDSFTLAQKGNYKKGIDTMILFDHLSLLKGRLSYFSQACDPVLGPKSRT
jgi:hypothetical protein